MWLLNAFSLQMLKAFPAKVTMTEIAEPADLTALQSAIGHADTAAVLGVTMNRVNVALGHGDEAIVAQLVGGRLPEGSTELPEGCRFRWIKVVVD